MPSTCSDCSIAILTHCKNSTDIRRILKTKRWLWGTIIGSAPFFIMILLWIFFSIFASNFLRCYQQWKHQRQSAERKNPMPITNI